MFLWQDIATSLGLTATEQDYGVMYPTPLFTKPILCIQDFNETIRQYATKVTQSGSPLIVYPSFTDSDIMRPFLLSKLYLQVFSGCAWSKSGPTFLEGAVDVRCVKLRLAFSSQLFFKPAPYASSCADKLPPGYRDALLGVLSGDSARVILLPSNDAVMQSSANDSASNLTIEDLAKGKDVIFTTKVMKYLLKQHKDWHEMGLAYDCGSSLYTSERLKYPGWEHDGIFTDGPQYEEDITWPDSKEVNLKVVITPVSLIVPPVEGE